MSVTPDGGDYNARVLIYSMFFISQKFGPRYGPKLYMIIIKRSDVAWNDSLCLTVWLSTLPPPLFVCVCVGSYFLSLVKLLLDFGCGQQRNGRNWHRWSSPPIPPPPSLKKEKKKEQYDPYKNINISQKQETWLWPFFSFFKLSNVKCTLLLGQDATEIEANFFFECHFTTRQVSTGRKPFDEIKRNFKPIGKQKGRKQNKIVYDGNSSFWRTHFERWLNWAARSIDDVITLRYTCCDLL